MSISINDVKVGDVFGNWTIVEILPKTVNYHKHFICKCVCGKTKEIDAYNVLSGKSTSCGCVRDLKTKERMTKHGQKQTRLYNIWCSMKERCNNPNSQAYKDYGGGSIDLTPYQTKALGSAIESETTVEGALGALSTNKQAKTLTTSVESQTTVEGALGALSTNKATQAEVNDIVSVLGAKNLLPNNATSQTINGVTFTVNTDGSITVNGTASATLALEINQEIPLDSSKSYILNGCADGGEWESYRLDVYEHSNGLGFIGVQTTEELIISNKSSAVVRIRIASGTVISNKTFKPMLRLASDPDNTYQPYAMTNRQITPYVQAISNPNLLDNPWFTVNQRGKSSYSTNGAYTVDRWINWSTEGETVAVNSDHSITLNKSASDKTVNIVQVIEEDVGELLVGKTVTLSALLSDGTIKSVSGVVVKDNTFIIGVYLDDTTKFKLDFYRYSNKWNARVISWAGGTSAAGSITIKAVKLELGSVSTLAMDTAPNYATELLKCQRYFERNNWYDWCCVNCTMAGQLNFGMSYPFLVKKRASPTFAFNVPGNTGIGNGYVKDLTDGTNIPASEVVLQQPGAWNFRMIQMKLTHSSFTVGHTYAVGVGDNTVDISADL